MKTEEGREPVDDDAAPPVRLRVVEVVLDHAGAGHGEAGEDADGVEGDQPVELGPVDEHQRERDRGQHQDAVGEGEPVAPPGELAGQEAVPGHEAGQVRETR